MKLNSIILICGLILLASCNKQGNDNSQTYPISISFDKQSFPEELGLAEATKTLRLLALETNDNCMVDRVLQADQIGKRIFVLPYSKSKGVLVFNEKGKFLYNIGRIGKGPGEFTELIGFSFSLDQKTIYLVSYDDKKLCAYSIEGGFIKDIKLSRYTCDVEFLSDNEFVGSNLQKYFFYFGGMDKAETTDSIKWTTGLGSVGVKLFSRGSEDNIIYSTPLLDTVFSISKDEMIKKYFFDFGQQQCTSEEHREARQKAPFYPQNKYIIARPFLESENYFMFGLMRQLDSKYFKTMIIFNRKTQESHNLIDDIMFFAASHPLGITSKREYVSVLYPAYLEEPLEKIRSNENFNYPKDFMETLDQMEVEDNPLLLFYTIR